MLRLTSFALLIFAAAACGGSGGSVAEGPLRLGVISGQNQVVNAGATQLPAPVVGKLVHAQTASGFRFELVKTAYAQTEPTVVTGSPVVGANVCAVSPVAGSMVPFVPCTNTDANGQAVFFFTPGTKAGAQISEIRGLLNGQPAVFDTARATVNAAAANPAYHTSTSPYSASPMVVDATAVQDVYGNAVPFRIVPDSRISVQDTTTGSVGARTVIFLNANADNVDHFTELRGVANVLVGYLRYHLCPNGCAGTGPSGTPFAYWVSGGANFPNP